MEIKVQVTQYYIQEVSFTLSDVEKQFFTHTDGKELSAEEIGLKIQNYNQYIYELAGNHFKDENIYETDIEGTSCEEENRFDIYEDGKKINGGSL